MTGFKKLSQVTFRQILSAIATIALGLALVLTLQAGAAHAQVDPPISSDSDVVLDCKTQQNLLAELSAYQKSAIQLRHNQEEYIKRHEHTLQIAKIGRTSATIGIAAGTVAAIVFGGELALPALPSAGFRGIFFKMSGLNLAWNLIRSGAGPSLLPLATLTIGEEKANADEKVRSFFLQATFSYVRSNGRFDVGTDYLNEAIEGDLLTFQRAHEEVEKLNRDAVTEIDPVILASSRCDYARATGKECDSARVPKTDHFYYFGWDRVRRLEARIAIAQAHRDLYEMQRRYTTHLIPLIQHARCE